MTAITKRELKAYFVSPIGYVFLAVFYVFAGLFFYFGTLLSNTTSMSATFGNMFMVVIFLIPFLTMRLFSEERRQRTDQALLTSPINLTSLVLGKFLASVLMFLIGMAIFLVFGLVVTSFAMPNWAEIAGNFVGMLLLGVAFISIGMFISSLTENQMVAAVATFAVAFFIAFFDSLISYIPIPFLYNIASGLSFMTRYSRFTTGIFDLTGVLFFLSICAVFIFLTIRVQEKRRWN